MPRNIEFLFSANRLNVALSRAQCLAVVAASPKLLETPCRSIEQLPGWSTSSVSWWPMQIVQFEEDRTKQPMPGCT